MKVINQILEKTRKYVDSTPLTYALKRKLKRTKELHLPTWVKHPTNIQIDIHNYCNLWMEGKGCIHCNVKPSGGWNLPRGTMPMSMIKYIMDYWSLHGANSVALYINGEPLLDKRLPQMCDYAQKRGLKCFVDTNATLYENRHMLVHPNMAEVRFSFSATTPQTYEIVHGAPFFDHAKATIKWFLKNKFPNQETLLYYITNRYNQNELKPYVKYWRRYPVHLVLFPLHEVEGIQTESTKTRPDEHGYWNHLTKEITGHYPYQPFRAIDIYPNGRCSIRHFSEYYTCQGATSFSVAWNGLLLHCTDIPYTYNYGHISKRDMLDVWRERNLAKIGHPACSVCNVKSPEHDAIIRKYLLS